MAALRRLSLTCSAGASHVVNPSSVRPFLQVPLGVSCALGWGSFLSFSLHDEAEATFWNDSIAGPHFGMAQGVQPRVILVVWLTVCSVLFATAMASDTLQSILQTAVSSRGYGVVWAVLEAMSKAHCVHLGKHRSWMLCEDPVSNSFEVFVCIPKIASQGRFVGVISITYYGYILRDAFGFPFRIDIGTNISIRAAQDEESTSSWFGQLLARWLSSVRQALRYDTG